MLRASKAFFHFTESIRLKNYSDYPRRAPTSPPASTLQQRSFRAGENISASTATQSKPSNEWPSQPPFFKPAAANYASHVRCLALCLLSATSESLSVKSGYLESVLGRHAQHMVINYYPQCPQPELTYGLPRHKDPDVITTLMQDRVSDLQLMRDGNWVAVEAEADKLVVNVGDQL